MSNCNYSTIRGGEDTIMTCGLFAIMIVQTAEDRFSYLDDPDMADFSLSWRASTEGFQVEDLKMAVLRSLTTQEQVDVCFLGRGGFLRLVLGKIIGKKPRGNPSEEEMGKVYSEIDRVFPKGIDAMNRLLRGYGSIEEVSYNATSPSTRSTNHVTWAYVIYLMGIVPAGFQNKEYTDQAREFFREEVRSRMPTPAIDRVDEVFKQLEDILDILEGVRVDRAISLVGLLAQAYATGDAGVAKRLGYSGWTRRNPDSPEAFRVTDAVLDRLRGPGTAIEKVEDLITTLTGMGFQEGPVNRRVETTFKKTSESVSKVYDQFLIAIREGHYDLIGRLTQQRIEAPPVIPEPVFTMPPGGPMNGPFRRIPPWYEKIYMPKYGPVDAPRAPEPTVLHGPQEEWREMYGPEERPLTLYDRMQVILSALVTAETYVRHDLSDYVGIGATDDGVNEVYKEPIEKLGVAVWSVFKDVKGCSAHTMAFVKNMIMDNTKNVTRVQLLEVLADLEATGWSSTQYVSEGFKHYAIELMDMFHDATNGVIDQLPVYEKLVDDMARVLEGERGKIVYDQGKFIYSMEDSSTDFIETANELFIMMLRDTSPDSELLGAINIFEEFPLRIPNLYLKLVLYRKDIRDEIAAHKKLLKEEVDQFEDPNHSPADFVPTPFRPKSLPFRDVMNVMFVNPAVNTIRNLLPANLYPIRA